MKRNGIDRGAAAANRSPIFPGEVRTRKLVADGDAAPVRVTAVTVQAGTCNRRGRHTTDQVSVVTEGTGIVATEGGTPHR
ncbi:MAG TPA: hypothetical protein VER37_10580, partial [Thermomicrobiales bacterium]|nr:hypothetical protein [Thermomicrobiales bacterium]